MGLMFRRRRPLARMAVGAATAGVSKLPSELAEVLQLQAAHGTGPLLAALARAVQFRRWRAADVRSILAAAGAAPNPQPAGQALVLTLPTVPTRSLDAYKINNTMIDNSTIVDNTVINSEEDAR